MNRKLKKALKAVGLAKKDDAQSSELEIRQKHYHLCAQAGELQYKIGEFQSQLNDLNKEIRGLNKAMYELLATRPKEGAPEVSVGAPPSQEEK